MNLLCPRNDCKLVFDLNAREEYRRANGIPYSAQTEECFQCGQCAQRVCWERIVHTAKDGTVTVEHRRMRDRDADAA